MKTPMKQFREVVIVIVGSLVTFWIWVYAVTPK